MNDHDVSPAAKPSTGPRRNHVAFTFAAAVGVSFTQPDGAEMTCWVDAPTKQTISVDPASVASAPASDTTIGVGATAAVCPPEFRCSGVGSTAPPSSQRGGCPAAYASTTPGVAGVVW